MIKIRMNRTAMKPGNVRFDSLVEECTRELEAFLVYNPSCRSSAYIDVLHAGRGVYKAMGRYSCTQGTRTVKVVYSHPVAR